MNRACSGARRQLASTQRSAVWNTIYSEVPIISTGYEPKFGEKSSSVINSEDCHYKIIAKVSKFSFAPNHHYYLIVLNEDTNELDYWERICHRTIWIFIF